MTGSRAKLINSLKKAATPPSSRPAKEKRVSKRSRVRLPARMNRAEATEKGAPADSLVDGDDSDLDASDQGVEDPMSVDLPAHTVEDSLSAQEPVMISPSLFTSDQLRSIQDTVQSSISQAIHGGQSAWHISFPGCISFSASPIGNSVPYGFTPPVGKELGGQNFTG